MNEKFMYLKEREVSELIGRAVGTLRNDRLYRRGLPYIKMSGSIRYKLQDVEEWMAAHKVEHEG